MKLIIAEKPSVAQAIAAVLGAVGRKAGYLEGNGYLVSWCFGHLAELAHAESYDPGYAKWCQVDLPILPNDWNFTILPGKQAQFDILSALMHRPDVTEVVNACDAGREGELIFRTVYHLAACTLPMKRLWISSMEEDAIRAGFAALRPGSAYNNLYQAALCRAKADWLVGINATRLFSVLYHHTVNVGRVVSPTLALLTEREEEIARFQPETHYTPILRCEGFSAEGERYSDKEQAKAVASACDGSLAYVTEVTERVRKEKAPKLYDLTTLQRDANRILGYTAQQTLDYLQSLYEKKLCTYPRTESRYLTDDMGMLVRGIAAIAAGICHMDAPETIYEQQVCDSRYVSDHHAIIPTLGAGNADIDVLPIGEREVMRLIARQLLRGVSAECRWNEVRVTAECAGYVFTAKGKQLMQRGWRAYDRTEQGVKLLPALEKGQSLSVDCVEIREGVTEPPAHYTEDTLLHAMETAGKNPVDAEHQGIGTPATRAAVLEKLVSGKFMQRKKARTVSHLVPTEEGKALVTVLPELLLSPALTAQWEQQLKEIEQGTLSSEVFLSGIESMVRNLVEHSHRIPAGEALFRAKHPDVVGTCPRCSGRVVESKRGFFCESFECRFGLWKDNKYFAAKQIALSRKLASALLSDGRVSLKDLYSERTGKHYDAELVMEDNGEFVRYHLEFPKKSTRES